MTDTINTWPGKPGVPLNPTEDEPHWLSWRDEKPRAVEWDSQSLAPVEDEDKQGFWRFGNLYGTPEQVAADGWRYLGPVLTPDEAAALQVRADRNAAGFARVDAEAERAKFLHKQKIAALEKRVAELEGALATARREGMKEAARIAAGSYPDESRYDPRSPLYGMDLNPDRSEFGRGKETGRKEAAAAIRAAAKEVK